MTRTTDPAADLERSWTTNARAWTEAVRSGGIAGRRLATDAAIVEAVLARRPARVLDLGCGEGWLARALAGRGVAVVGVDGSAPLIEAARAAAAADGGDFRVLSYAELAADPARAGTGFDAVAANFALLHDDAAPLLRALRRVLAPGGALIVQTVHPATAGAPYRDGWRTEDFRGFGGGEGVGGAAWRPMPWYFRTIGSWVALLRAGGYGLTDLREPLHPESLLPLSLLLVADPT